MSYGSLETWNIRKTAVASRAGVVVAQHHRAAAVGARILAEGGNAVDAAVGTSLAIQGRYHVNSFNFLRWNGLFAASLLGLDIMVLHLM